MSVNFTRRNLSVPSHLGRPALKTSRVSHQKSLDPITLALIAAGGYKALEKITSDAAARESKARRDSQKDTYTPAPKPSTDTNKDKKP
jgi:hypothetical protein